jgi:hypothetical protein
MSAPSLPQTAEPHPASLRLAFLALLPRIELHGRVRFRGLKCPHRREEAVAEMVALSWKWCLRLAQRGKDVAAFPSALAAFAARAVRAGRRLCGQERSNDALSPLAQRRHGFATQGLPAHDTSAEGNAALDALRDNTRTPPPDQAAFRLDFPAWLAAYPDRDRRLILDLMAGERTADAARTYGLTPGRISQMRRRFLQDWQRFGEPPPA